MKKLKSVFMLAVAVLMLAACSSSQLKTQTDGLKGSLPYKIGDVANVSSMDVADGVLTVEVTVSENNGKVSDLKADSGSCQLLRSAALRQQGLIQRPCSLH